MRKKLTNREKNYDLRVEWYRELIEKIAEMNDRAETDGEKTLIGEIAKCIKECTEIEMEE